MTQSRRMDEFLNRTAVSMWVDEKHWYFVRMIYIYIYTSFSRDSGDDDDDDDDDDDC